MNSTNTIPGFSDALSMAQTSAGGLANDILSAVSVVLFAFIGLTVCYLACRLLRKASSGPMFNA